MEKTPKSRLNEACQLHVYPTPIYIDRQSEVDLLWTSEVRIGNGQSYIGDPQKSKRDAQQSAAQLALEYELFSYRLKPRQYNFPFLQDKRVICIIDYENLPQMADFLQQIPDIVTYIVVGQFHHKSESQFPWAKKIICPSMGRDAVDHCISMLLSHLMSKSRKHTTNNYILVSRDKFVSPLLEMIKNPPTKTTFHKNRAISYSTNPQWAAADGIIATTPDHVLAALEKWQNEFSNQLKY